MPGPTMDDVVTARADDGRLDQTDAPVRLRLNSTVVKVQHVEATPSAQGVIVSYMRAEKLQTLRAKNCVLACYNTLIPYLCPELPEKQKTALRYGIKAPLVYSQVAIRNWESFQRLGVSQIVAPGSYHSYVALDFPVSLGQYKFPSRPDEPMVVFMVRVPCYPGQQRRDQYKAGRLELMNTPFATFERNIRDQLGRMLGATGFDPARDVQGITVNRWAHGYAYDYSALWDPEWPKGERPNVVGRQRYGRIAIANCDAGASAYTNVAVDQAHRAVRELLENS
jgi:spermidine dehydrogenase